MDHLVSRVGVERKLGIHPVSGFVGGRLLDRDIIDHEGQQVGGSALNGYINVFAVVFAQVHFHFFPSRGRSIADIAYGYEAVRIIIGGGNQHLVVFQVAVVFQHALHVELHLGARYRHAQQRRNQPVVIGAAFVQEEAHAETFSTMRSHGGSHLVRVVHHGRIGRARIESDETGRRQLARE